MGRAPAPSHQEALDAFVNPNKQTEMPRQQEEEIDYGEDPIFMGDDDAYGGGGGGGDYGGQEQEERPSPNFATVDDEKADLMNKIGRLEKKGFSVNKRLTAYSPVDELRAEVKRVMYSIEVDQSVRFSKRMLIACVTGLEFLNKRYNPFDLQLEGWSESVMENQDDYDTVFEELYVKYRTKMHVAPEVKLILMLGGSAMMFHLTSTMMKSLPNMGDVLKQNPEMMKNMMQAAQNMGKAQTAAPPATQSPEINDTSSGGQYEMQGPGIDLGSLMSGMVGPPLPVNTTPEVPKETTTKIPVVEDDISDIVSISGESTGGEVKEVAVSAPTKKRTRRKKKTEINL
tara:strand:- start:33 stop:1058 length:1026 start_codon:yes stop_codon:yes gene_type:complete